MESENINYSLSPKNLNRIPFDKYSKDFTFNVNGKRFESTRLEADILSPIIRKLHFTDESISEFYIDISDQETNLIDYFEDFLSLCHFENITIDPTRQKIYSTYFYKLGNIDEYIQLQTNHFKTISKENVIILFNSILQLTNNFSDENDHISQKIHEIISFISNNFEEIDKEEIKRFPIFILEQILNEDTLKINDEDSLFNFVLELYEEDHSYSPLFEYVLFNNISEKSLEAFIDKFNIEDINSKIWDQICIRILQSKIPKLNDARYLKPKRPKGKVFDYESGKEFKGVFHHIQEETNGKIENEINVTASSYRGSDIPANVLMFDKDNYFYANNAKNTWICFDFKNHRIIPTNYSIKSFGTAGNAHPKTWIIEGSNDNKNWVLIDSQENCPYLKESNFYHTFPIQKEKSKEFKYIRMCQTGQTWRNDDVFLIHSFELFGELI